MKEATDVVHDACRRIGVNPVAHLGLANKELFHSNFLAWLAESEPSAASIALGTILEEDATHTEHRVRREHKNLDLIIELPGYRPVVIENKTFAIADLAQLERYSTDKLVKTIDPTCVLLSLGDPHWSGGSVQVAGRRWKWFAYTTLADGLRAALHAVDDDFGVVLIKRYITLLDDLVTVGDAFTDPSDDATLLPAPRDLVPLKRTRLHDGVLKLRVRSVGAELERTSSHLMGGRLERLATGFTHGHPFVEMFAGDPDHLLLGWQLQERQFRLAAIFPTLQGRTENLRSLRSTAAASLKEAGIWFDFAPAEAILSDVAVPVVKGKPDVNGFNRFDPAFVYAYRLTKGITVGHVRRLNETYSALAAGLDLRSITLPSPS